MNEIIQGDVLQVLKGLPPETIDCCVTSPPYWGLRDYGTAKWEGGDEKCDHIQQYNSMQSSSSTLGGRKPEDTLDDKRREINMPYKEICGKCGAKRIDDQIGLEKTPEEYVSKMVEVFREVKRVLKKEGTLFLNLGDSYMSGGGPSRHEGYNDPKWPKARDGGHIEPTAFPHPIIKPKDLVGIPWAVAFALRADGWYLRQDIIWAKPNPMPESVTDRCTKSHEYIFLLAKSPKYYFDSESIKELSANQERTNYQSGSKKKNKDRNDNDLSERSKDWMPKRKNSGTNYGGNGTGFQDHSGYDNLENPYVRNKRSVWTVTTKPFKEAHFATFPEDLIVPMVLAGCPKDGVVLDPFMGAGTTAVVAKKNGRNYLGVELNEKYIKMAEQRIKGTPAQLL